MDIDIKQFSEDQAESRRIFSCRARVDNPGSRILPDQLETVCQLTERQEPPIFEGLKYEEFNNYLRDRNIDTDGPPVSSRIVRDEGRFHDVIDDNSPTPPGDKTGEEGLNIMHIAQYMVGQGRDAQEYESADEMHLKLVDEKNILWETMLGRTDDKKRQVHLDKSSKEALNFFMNLYLGAYRFIPQHCCLHCDYKTDALQCCWSKCFTDLVADNLGSRRHAKLLYRFKIAITHVLAQFMAKKGMKMVNWPIHVHVIMEDWNRESRSRPTRKESEAVKHLARETGLLPQQIRSYQSHYKTRKYNLATGKEQPRLDISALPKEFTGLPAKAASFQRSEELRALVTQYPGKKFSEIPQGEQSDLLKQFGMTKDKLSAWWGRVRRREETKFLRRLENALNA